MSHVLLSMVPLGKPTNPFDEWSYLQYHLLINVIRSLSPTISLLHHCLYPSLHRTFTSFVLYLRLFTVMGVSWIMEAISFFTDPDGAIYWVTDVINTMQGLLIFLLFVLKQRVLRLAIKRFVNKLYTQGS